MSTITIGNSEYSPDQVILQAEKSAGWFRLIAIFSIINTALGILNVSLNFMIGLATTQIIDGIVIIVKTEYPGTPAVIATVVGLIVNALIVGLFMLIWWLAKRGNRPIYVVGMVLYFLDGLLFLLGADWLGIGFHAFFLFMLWGGYQFMKARDEAQEMLANIPLTTGTDLRPIEAEAAAEFICAECLEPVDGAVMIQFGNRNVCPECKDIYVQRIKEGVDR